LAIIMKRTAIILVCLLVLAAPAWAGQTLLAKGIQAQKAGRNAAALKLLNEYVKRYPQVAAARYYRALALNGLGRKQEALADVDKALADNPNNLKALMLKGDLLASLGRRPEAILVYSRIIKFDPKSAEAYKQEGDCLSQLGKFDAALADFNRAARLAPTDPWVFNKRGLVWFCKGDYQKAVTDFTHAIHLQPDLALSYFFRGNMYNYHLKQRDKAIADYQQGCRLGSTLCCNELEKMEIKPEKK
jgi:tetratricopeptide (TPR) repeat protein